MKWLPFWTVTALLFLTALTLQVRGDVDHVPPSTPLAEMPETIGNWQGTDIPVAEDTLQILGKGVFLNRVYQQTAAPAADQGAVAAPNASGTIGLFIGYFPTQRTGQSIHSPQNCLPGSGWTFESSGLLNLPDSQGRGGQIGDYLISDGIHKAEVLYWYQTQGHRIAGDYKAKGYMLMDSIRYGRTDAALVRVITPLQPGETRLQAQQRALGFTRQMAPLLPAYIPD